MKPVLLWTACVMKHALLRNKLCHTIGLAMKSGLPGKQLDHEKGCVISFARNQSRA